LQYWSLHIAVLGFQNAEVLNIYILDFLGILACPVKGVFHLTEGPEHLGFLLAAPCGSD
jgi:hypothetical protein